MISGFDKYFQIVRCFRDEDLRADRQPEFTQIDLEMSYPQPERVWEVVEGFLTAAFKAAGHEIKTPFPRMDFDDAIRQYGIDKPDLRLPAFTDVGDCFAPDELQALAINKDLPVIAIRIPQGGRAFAQRARRHQAALCLQRRSARLRRLQAHREQISRGGEVESSRQSGRGRRRLAGAGSGLAAVGSKRRRRIPPASAISHARGNGHLRLGRTAARGPGAEIFRPPQAFPERRLPLSCG